MRGGRGGGGKEEEPFELRFRIVRTRVSFKEKICALGLEEDLIFEPAQVRMRQRETETGRDRERQRQGETETGRGRDLFTSCGLVCCNKSTD
jgi:hypothetical protein